MRPEPARALRCAIYTRVSTEYGLEQEFNSLDNQREAAEAYIKSQAHEGWRLLPARYDDGGFSGGTMDRPALQRLLADIRERRVDIIVVYKVDRLTRSLANFAKLVELFDAHEVSFVSVTQAFNTTSSMGRLTLNVLLSFAQFEREVTGERIRDKVAASKRKGMRMGGPVPLGYRAESKKLVIDPREAEQVRYIFRRYLEVGCLTKLINDLHACKVLTKVARRKNGSVRGGIPFGKGSLAYLLRNRVYIGEVIHKGRHFPGEHEPIFERELFDRAQAELTSRANGAAGGSTSNRHSPAGSSTIAETG
jgi:DNA invertase Pin-like site-specific DNA recombinase